MKVVHLNTYDGNGGAGRASYRLNTALKASGVESNLYTYIKFGKREDIHALYPGLLGRLYATGCILAERYLPKFYTKNLKIPFSLSFFGKDIHRHKVLQNADIIHLHWINHGFLNPRALAKLTLLNKPIVWTMHDSNTFTGGCHVRFSCENYQQACGHCPLLKKPSKEDVSAFIWKNKQKAYQQIKPRYIAPSYWLGNAAKHSGLLKNSVINVIPNTLETEVFKPVLKKEAREAIAIDSESFVLLSGFMPSKNDAHKGTTYLIAALNLWTSENPELKEKVILVVFGNKNEETEKAFDIPVKFLGTINDDEKLSKAYAAADVFLTTSLDDNLPNTVMESLACGTPVVSFTTGGIPDMVKHQQNGYLATYKDAQDFKQGIQWIYQHPEKEKISQNARQSVMDNFSEKIIAKKHIQLYQEILANNAK